MNAPLPSFRPILGYSGPSLSLLITLKEDVRRLLGMNDDSHHSVHSIICSLTDNRVWNGESRPHLDEKLTANEMKEAMCTPFHSTPIQLRFNLTLRREREEQDIPLRASLREDQFHYYLSKYCSVSGIGTNCRLSFIFFTQNLVCLIRRFFRVSLQQFLLLLNPLCFFMSFIFSEK